MAAFKDVGDRALGYGSARVGLRILLRHSIPHSGFDDRGAVAPLQKKQPTERLGKGKGKFFATEGAEDTEEGHGAGLTALFARTYA